ncbi:cobyrinate a,c-diamide synthase [Methylocystis heyeri]|uniref:Hydrogenobyrinate a,c-diamide synthase n=1 Tax=Methylocystis heyeri TaxID=391905 RepID=A0A6B8KFR2_9HYPH|nr:cobyrinate a,c-diamide synthase [Methylocystis heyeri]QGM45270.1 cobyrinate a,c-diamide synthase [Methylocystis heyeri]
MSAPGLVIAAVRSGSGKTTVALGLMRALTRRGMRVGAAKCGPDYIDPAFHAVATGRQSLNLDSWTMAPELVERLAGLAGAQADIVVAEGAMGLFDGAPNPPGRSGASADIAAAMGWPVVLVHDVSGQGQTAAAIVRGVAAHDPRLKLAGAVLNKVASERHRKLAGEAIEALGVPVLGALARDAGVILPERHLGLVQARETSGLDAMLDALADRVEAGLDIEALCAAAAGGAAASGRSSSGLRPPGQRIAVAQDEAFSFFYPHLALDWRALGAELVFFSPLADEPPPPQCDVCWLPGGYPELHAGRIAGAQCFLSGLRRFAQTRPVHGECGGYMVLGRGLVDAEGVRHAMAGLLELETSFSQRKLNLGYRRARLSADHRLGAAGADLFGHEFHYATILREEGAPFAFVCDAYSERESPAGLRAGDVSGSFFHAIA